MFGLTTSNTIFVIIQLLACLFLVTVIIVQSGKRSGLSGAIAGVADSFMSQNKARTWDARLARITKWVAVLFAIVTMLLNIRLG
ncbi:MAG: preprotein translocase subunit SecG [Oscillospiraceae bacterium]|nr:preprotein translocase subunit SecG [Oscillospiraceae bacterium]